MKSEVGQAAQPAVRLAKDAIRIDGKAEVLLCSSLFYFRIPRALWRDRLEKVKSCGYNCIDVYFPWNYHEERQGEWDFAGEKDVRQFLREAAECGLWVVARPGPYICSEWDGGALPAYLLAEEGVRLRDNDPRYLHHVERWYARIMPIVQEAQRGLGGSVIAVQLENELDFYGCEDPHGYIASLRDMALGHGIAVPLVACAGQGGLHEASGSAAGVVPTCNFYPNDRDPEFENKAQVYARHAAQLDVPLLVTETNRSHFLLRRLLSCGAKLLGPYLQTSGTNFGFTNAINNWGDPLSFLTSDYDFGGMISPEGHLREEAYEGRLLRRVLDVYGEALAAAEPLAAQEGGLGQLSLCGGGRLLFAPNVGDSARQVRVELGEAESPAPAAVAVQPGRCQIMPLQVPLSLWGAGAGTLSATAELFHTARLPSRTVLLFHAEGNGEIRLAAGGDGAVLEACTLQANEAENGVTALRAGKTAGGVAVTQEGETGEGLAALRSDGAEDGMALHRSDEIEDGVTVSEADETEDCVAVYRVAEAVDGVKVLRFGAERLGSAVVRLPGGERVELVVISREQALLLERYDDALGPIFGRRVRIPNEPQDVAEQWAVAAIDPGRSMAADSPVELGDQADYLERHGVYRGYAWYDAEVSLPGAATCLGVLVHNAGDVLSLYADGAYAGTAVPGGGSRLFPFASRIAGSFGITARTEIWGHSNFNDARLPGLRLNSLKGLTGAVAVTSIRDITQNWAYQRGHGPRGKGIEPIVSFGGWLSAEHPAEAVYRRRVKPSPHCDSWTLHLPGLASQVEVYVDGKHAGTVHPPHPYADLTRWAAAGRELELALAVTRWYGSATGKAVLYEGTAAKRWRLSACGEAELAAAAAAASRGAQPAAAATVRLKPGQMSWLFGRLDDSGGGAGWRVYASGSGMKLTAFLNGRIVGRLWLQNGSTCIAEAARSAETADAAETVHAAETAATVESADATRSTETSQSAEPAAVAPIFRGGSADSFYLPGVWFREADNELALLLEAVSVQAGTAAIAEAAGSGANAPACAPAVAHLAPLRFVPAAAPRH